MKLFLVTTFSLFFFIVDVVGQEKVKRVEYSFSLNLQDYEEGFSYKSVLYFNETESLFIYNSKELEKKSGFKKSIKSKSKDIQGVLLFRYFDETGNKIYHNTKSGRMISRDFLGGDYAVQVNEDTPNFEWIVTDSTKFINGYNSYKAISKNFRGREYTAWFTYDLPVSFGPWKFNGLPGLILEVYDTKKLVHITLAGNQFPVKIENNIIITAPSETQIMDPTEFMEINFQWYLNGIREKKSLGQARKITPLPYAALEYTIIQESSLQENKTIKPTDDFN